MGSNYASANECALEVITFFVINCVLVLDHNGIVKQLI